MRKIIKKIRFFLDASREIVTNDGVGVLAKRVYKKIDHKLNPHKRHRAMRDVLFVVGPHLPQVKRYRVDHQVEQLIANGMTAEVIDDDKLALDDVKYYRGFVFCRYPHTDKAEQFIEVAKSFNKTIIFEIDDLVFDTNFTNNIKVVKEMSKVDRDLYDSGVTRSQQTLKMCDFAVTTTDPLAQELRKYSNIKDVYVNRNVVSDEMVAISNQVNRSIRRDEKNVTIGYFSGSITHNEDFDMVRPALVELLQRHPHVRLFVGGILDEQSELAQFGERVMTTGFVDWRELPKFIRQCDINLAPLAQKNVFNESKSEIKWLDAALVESVTVASDFGAFRTEIEDGVTGVLVKSDADWYEVLDQLIASPDKRRSIAKKAYIEAVTHRTTIATGKKFADWLREIFAPNVAFVIPSSEISGGVNVVLKHADILRSHGKDVTIINTVSKSHHTPESRKLDNYNEVIAYKTDVLQRVDEMVATLWATVPYVRSTPSSKVKSYFVQNFETDFLPAGSVSRLEANSTYSHDDIKYTTMSLWCQQWLRDSYGQTALYASNGLWSERYTHRERQVGDGKIKILIEGDPQSEWKNVDEAFRIANKLDKNKYEVNFLSYYANPKEWYEVDNFYQKVPSEKVGEVYAANDILLKTSLLESFSYPPLEMMATGGYVVVVPNGGNREYLKDEENCLMFESGDETKAIAQIERIVNDKSLRQKLSQNSKKIVADYDWSSVEEQILGLYE